MEGAAPAQPFVAALDVGTTSIRCHIVDASGNVIATATDSVDNKPSRKSPVKLYITINKQCTANPHLNTSRTETAEHFRGRVKLLYPKRGYVEIDPEVLWESSRKVVEDAIKAAGLRPEQVTALGVSTQRSTFVTWDRATGKPFHNFITWKDVRADSIVRQWNSSFTWRAMRFGARCLYAVTGSKRFLAGSVLRLMNSQVTCRFSWALSNVPALREAVAQRRAAFGTVDTWLMYKMTAGRCHVTDVSSASATGFFDPFTMTWGSWALGLFGIPEDALPAVGDSAGALGESDPAVWGAAIPIRSLVNCRPVGGRVRGVLLQARAHQGDHGHRHLRQHQHGGQAARVRQGAVPGGGVAGQGRARVPGGGRLQRHGQHRQLGPERRPLLRPRPVLRHGRVRPGL
ncbi:hypothetical protein FOCC_FOCC000056 [Frankliniella occidentalis]|nr:hypothetical protein FOCC_FOCC000056 [Frankliniella occidentalis]